MPETLPRWGMPDVNFIETDPEKIKSDIINRYETAAGRTLSAGDPVRLFLLTIASEIIQLRQVFNHGAQQNLLTYAQGSVFGRLGRVPRYGPAAPRQSRHDDSVHTHTSAFERFFYTCRFSGERRQRHI